ncbi:DUF397 domain-containing protein [Actinomadura rudentiformis]|uniref:DUF397 domain-containing protein n=1 Tax=Actinomadura rudentiformis TaxID=359158 RepID=A0A6H9Z8Q7_9ACTN|nr:DUF397 domain-containing protein [Actinomadura rudentiformis]KAB2350276.1 DUF397 domain-containing protein [Actinomadura rudentiformis]
MNAPVRVWRKSSHSSTQGGDCVEVANLGGNIGLRDSKAPEDGHVTIPVESFAALMTRVKRNELNL